jgi:hypothetical protein
MTARSDNAPRFHSGTDHVESWFLRANDPTSPRAIWLKATVLTKTDGTRLSQAWFSVFDGDRTEAACLDVPLDQARFDDSEDQLDVVVGPLTWQIAEDSGTSHGSLEGGHHTVTWDLRFTRAEGSLGATMSLLPTARLVDAPFPKNKLLSPFPLAQFAGTVTWGEETWDLAGWHGMQGHNWGAAHSPEYAWGQCVFTDVAGGEPFAVLEAASGRIPLGPVQSPFISMLVLRCDGAEYRFDRLVDLWRQHPDVAFPRWGLQMTGADGVVDLEMTGRPEAMVCLAYQNPARATSYCLNSKTAEVRVRVRPRNGHAFELVSAHGGALEFLASAPVPEIAPVVG